MNVPKLRSMVLLPSARHRFCALAARVVVAFALAAVVGQAGCSSTTVAPPAPDLSVVCDGFVCSGGCDSDLDCKDGKKCDPASHSCQMCVVDKDCASGQLCAASSHTCVQGCSSGHTCASDGGVCEVDAGQCVQCLADPDCTDPQNPRCDATTNRCFPCNTDKDNCGHATYCVQAMNAFGCSPGCKDDTDCSPLGGNDGGVPNGDGGPGPGPGPDGGGGGVSDGGGPNDDGGGGPMGGNATRCEPRMHQCVECLADNDCALGKICTGNACVPGCNAMHACPNALSCCGGGCVDETSDSSNCGACAMACAGGSNCCVSKCSDPVLDVTNCGGCGIACMVANGTPGCMNRGCTISACNVGWGDCNGSYLDGCEMNVLTSVVNCGVCGKACALAHATPTCTAGICRVAKCLPNYEDCNKVSVDGCEINTIGSDVSNCGACGKACNGRNGTPSCSVGVCQIACNQGWGDCDLQAATGCEVDLTTTVGSCGACGKACSAVNGTASCVASACQIACNVGWGDCDGDITNGCETNLLVTTSSCGVCGNVCSTVNGTASCAAGACQIACSAGWADCDGNVKNGCETNLNTTPGACGACGAGCSGQNVLVNTCLAGSCTGTCANGFGDCNANLRSDGCETNLNTNVAACGGCGAACSGNNMSLSTCTAGSCTGGCKAGYGDCNGDLRTDGCEINLNTTVSSCGGCGTGCPGTNMSVNTCTNGACTGTCAAGFGDCNANLRSDGCEVNLNITVASCGACGLGCPGTNMNSNTCTNGSCTGTCAPGFADCNANLRSDGCETNTNTDLGSCGGCGKACPGTNMSVNTCTAGVCTGTCNAGFGDCNANLLSDGCETNLNTTVAACGGCGLACPGTNMSANSCTNGACTGTCVGGWADCNANLRSDGCEVNTQTSVSSCGGCGLSCPGTNMSVNSCNAGVCSGTCAAGFSDCNANLRSDGCETNSATDIKNCGSCGSGCPGINMSVNTCTAGACTGTCAAGFGNCDGNLRSNGCETPTTSDIKNCGSCGNVCTAANAASYTCVAGACGVGACNANCWNLNNNYADGCECNTGVGNSGAQNVCGAQNELGAVAFGASLTETGTIAGTSTEHWYAVSFTNAGASYHPHVTLTTTAGSGVVMDIQLYSCNATLFGCGAEGGTSVGRTDFETNQTAGDPATDGQLGGVFTWVQPGGVGQFAPGTKLLVRVRGTAAVSCSSYSLVLKNG